MSNTARALIGLLLFAMALGIFFVLKLNGVEVHVASLVAVAVYFLLEWISKKLIKGM